ncbi:MAG: hypothetical protein HS116_11235 [Planctomycetes bacterium]|nr:hypothetical protein [Planctomycetota bacterium]
MSALEARTLYADWMLRRTRLADGAPVGEAGYSASQIKVLDYLLQRYEGDVAARVSARFPLPSETIWKTRTIVIHHHFGRKGYASVKTRGEAEDRASRILKRMAEQKAQESLGAPGGGTIWASPDPMLDQFGNYLSKEIQYWDEYLKSSFSKLEDKDVEDFARRIAKLEDGTRSGLLFKLFSEEHLPVLAESKIPHHRGGISFSREVPVFKLLLKVEHPEAVAFAHIAWRDRLEADSRCKIAEKLEELFRTPFNRPFAAEHLRGDLGVAHPETRYRAAKLLMELGDLQDVGLLQDLLALPRQDDEYPGERQALFAAMEELARKPAPPAAASP